MDGPAGKTVTVLGTGGAARAAVYAAILQGGRPVVAGRSESAASLGRRLRLHFLFAGDLGRIEAGCLINATPVGMVPDVKNTP